MNQEFGAWRSLAARLLWEQEVEGSNPFAPTLQGTGSENELRPLFSLRVSQGDQLYLVETERGIELTPYDPDFAEQMEIAERVMREDRDVLRRLAD